MEHALEKEKSLKNKVRLQEKNPIDVSIITNNSLIINNEISWLNNILENRIKKLLNASSDTCHFSECPPPELSDPTSPYASFIIENGVGAAERLLLISSLVPHISPEIFTEKLRNDNSALKIQYPKLGGYFDSTFTNFVPTCRP